MAQDDDGEKANTQAPTTDRLRRFAKLTSMGAGVVARHVGVRIANAFDSEHADERKKRSRELSASEMTKTFGELKGAAMKIGQLMATDPEFVPPEVAAQLATLQHSAPPMSFAMVRQVVEAALGNSLEDAFTSFDETPLGAASMGQVHRAVTRAGAAVAVKVQYPGIADTIDSDMKNFNTLMTLMRISVPKERADTYVDEVRTVLKRESDYLNEATNLERFQIVLKDVPFVRVPLPVHELTRKNVLVMEYLAGTRLDAWLKTATPAARDAQATRLVTLFLEMLHFHGALHADPHPGNFLVLDPAPGDDADALPNIGLLDLGCVRDYSLEFMDGLIRLLVALWRGDVDALQRQWRAVGFIDEGVDPELVFEWWELAFGPLLKNEVTDFGTWKVQDVAMRFILDHPSVKLLFPPREALFYVRVVAGLRSLLHQSGARLNAYALSRDIAKRRGLL